MAIIPPTIQEIQQQLVNHLNLSINSGQTDSSKLVDGNIRNSGIRGIANSFSAGFDENNDVINQLLKQLFPQDATGIYLEAWAAWFGITRLSAVKATGNVVFTGTATTSIPSGTLIQKTDGTSYETLATTPISAQTINVSSITRSGTLATVTTAGNHNLATGVSVTHAGAVQTDYNITAIISVTSDTTYTYTVAGSPTTPATGTITTSFITASISVQASDFGVGGNAGNGSQLTLTSPLPSVDNACYVGYSGLVNGLNLEEDEALRIRLQERTSNFTAPFTQSGLPVFIRQAVAGVTRIWVKDATPSAGYVTIYFVRDNDVNILPTSAQSLTVKNAIIDADTGIKPASTPDSYVLVSAPTGVIADFTFSSLSPNTTAMQTAITATLTDYFKSDSVAEGTDVTANEYNALIFGVIDANGNSPTFTLSSPVSTISVASGQLAVKGTIIYP
jgi:uncharacterized phage protein gp47/JayE